MTVIEFDRWVRLGLGRAVTRLRAEDDKSPFYGVVLRAAERRFGYTHLCGDYLYELTCCFNDTALLEAAAIETAGAICDTPVYHIGNSKLLAILTSNGIAAAREKLEALYTSLYAELAARTERSERKSDKTGIYMQLAFRLVTSIGAERLPGLLRDMAALFTRNKFFNEIEFTTFFNNARFRLGKAFDDTLDGLRADSPEVARLADRMAELRAIERSYTENPGTRPVSDVWSYEKMYDRLKNGDGRLGVPDYENLHELTLEQRRQLAVLTLECRDPERLENLLSVFVCNAVPWPLDPAPIVAMACERLNRSGGTSDQMARMIIDVLRNLRCDAVRELGLELVGRGMLREGAALWARNYRAEDREHFIEVFRQIDFPPDPHHNCVPMFETLDIIESDGWGTGNAPTELLEYIYERAPSEHIRYNTVELLHSHGLLDARLTEECRHDNFDMIREYIENSDGELLV